MPKYRCIVATPTNQLFSGDVEYANVPGIEGNFGVLPQHEQFVGLNRPGILELTLEGGEKRTFVIYNGISQVFNNHLTVLAQMGRELSEIDVAFTKEKLANAQAELEEIKREYDESDEAQIKTRTDYIAWCEAQIRAKETGMV